MGVSADTSVTPEETEPGSSSEQRSERQQSAPLWGMQLKPHDDPKKERMVSKALCFSANQGFQCPMVSPPSCKGLLPPRYAAPTQVQHAADTWRAEADTILVLCR